MNEFHSTEGEEHDSYVFPEFDYGAMVEENDIIEENETKVNLIIKLSFEQYYMPQGLQSSTFLGQTQNVNKYL